MLNLEKKCRPQIHAPLYLLPTLDQRPNPTEQARFYPPSGVGDCPESLIMAFDGLGHLVNVRGGSRLEEKPVDAAPATVSTTQRSVLVLFGCKSQFIACEWRQTAAHILIFGLEGAGVSILGRWSTLTWSTVNAHCLSPPPNGPSDSLGRVFEFLFEAMAPKVGATTMLCIAIYVKGLIRSLSMFRGCVRHLNAAWVGGLTDGNAEIELGPICYGSFSAIINFQCAQIP